MSPSGEFFAHLEASEGLVNPAESRDLPRCRGDSESLPCGNSRNGLDDAVVHNNREGAPTVNGGISFGLLNTLDPTDFSHDALNGD